MKVSNQYFRAAALMPAMALVFNVTQAADIRDQLDVQIAKAELVIPDMRPQDAGAKIKDALSVWGIPSSFNAQSIPSVMPARPGEPTLKDFMLSGRPASEYQCRNGYAEVTKNPPPINNTFMFAAERVQACLYPFARGVKVYVMFTSAKKTEALTSGIFNGITKAIRGKDEDYNAKRLNEEITAIRKNIPHLLVERIDVPGAELQEPDKEAVAQLIPAAQAQPPQVLVPAAPAGVAAVVVATANPNTKVEARKSLAGMGLTYHALDQFFAAIRRDDEVAVQLFLEAGAVKVRSKDANGKSAEEIALEAGASNAWQAIKLFASANPLAAAQEVAPAPPTDPKLAAEAARKWLPKDVLEGIDGMVRDERLPPEQAEAMRTKLTLQYALQLNGIQNLKREN